MGISLLIFAIIVCIVAGLLVYLVDHLRIPDPFNMIAKVGIIIVAILAICQRAGFI